MNAPTIEQVAQAIAGALSRVSDELSDGSDEGFEFDQSEYRGANAIFDGERPGKGDIEGGYQFKVTVERVW